MKKIFILFIWLAFTSLNANNHQGMALSAKRGNVQAQYDLGLLYKHGQGKTKNLKDAFKWMHKSALKGYTPAQYEFALMFHYGIGVKQNLELARLWFTRASKGGDSRAKSILYRFYAGKKVNYINKNQRQYYSQNFRTIRQ